MLLDLTDYTPERDLGSLRLLEPSSGSGAFLGPAVDRLIASANARGRKLSSLSDAIRAYDLQPEHVAASRALCRRLLSDAGLPDEIATNLAETWIQCADFLLPSEVEARAYDIAIGNPPYIRYDDLPSNLVAEYRSLWPTVRGRGDIYVGFIERCVPCDAVSRRKSWVHLCQPVDAQSVRD